MSIFEDLHSAESKAAYRASLAEETTERLQTLQDLFKQDHTNDRLNDFSRGLSGQKAAIIAEELQMRALREKYLGKSASAMTDTEANAYRISMSSRSVEDLTKIFNDLSADEQKTDLSAKDLRVLAEKKKMVNASMAIRKSGGFQG